MSEIKSSLLATFLEDLKRIIGSQLDAQNRLLNAIANSLGSVAESLDKIVDDFKVQRERGFR